MINKCFPLKSKEIYDSVEKYGTREFMFNWKIIFIIVAIAMLYVGKVRFTYYNMKANIQSLVSCENLYFSSATHWKNNTNYYFDSIAYHILAKLMATKYNKICSVCCANKHFHITKNDAQKLWFSRNWISRKHLQLVVYKIHWTTITWKKFNNNKYHFHSSKILLLCFFFVSIHIYYIFQSVTAKYVNRIRPFLYWLMTLC